MSAIYPPSELIINPDGTIFHLHLRPEQVANKVILCGDPDRITMVASHFDNRECEVMSREFHTITGTYHGKRITALSTGIGCDNIDIVMNELDALKNIDLIQRVDKPVHTTMEIVRIGTCGGLQPSTPIGTYVFSEYSIGFDGLLNYYDGRDEVCDLDFENAFKSHMKWDVRKGAPYVIKNSQEMLERICSPELEGMTKGVTISCGGFFGPQGRKLRIPLSDPFQNDKIMDFEYMGHKITNFEMESSAIAGLSALLGHKAVTVCMVIANRFAKEANANYKNSIDGLIELVLDKI